MPQVSETIPSTLQPRVDAALAWFNASADAAGDEFKVTGILDADAAVQAAGDDAGSGPSELRLILCGGDRCEQRSFQVSGSADAWQVEFANPIPAQHGEKPQAELDPPPGVRSSWLDKTLSQHAFVVLLFYRGFW